MKSGSDRPHQIARTLADVRRILLWVEETDLLLEETCQALARGGAYDTAWIALLDEVGLMVNHAEAGTDPLPPELLQQLQEGNLPGCVREVLQAGTASCRAGGGPPCPDCSLDELHRQHRIWCIPFRWTTSAQGILVVSTPGPVEDAPEELEDLTHLGEDLGISLERLRRDWAGRLHQSIQQEDLEQERSWSLRLARLQRELSVTLAASDQLEETLDACLQTALKGSGLEAGGIYLVTPEAGLELRAHHGLSSPFLQMTGSIPPESPRARIALTGETYYNYRSEVGSDTEEVLQREGILSIGVIPVLHRGEVVACFNVGSRRWPEIPEPARYALESIAVQVGAAIVRLNVLEELRHSERRFQVFIDRIEGTAYIKDAQGRFLYVNEFIRRNFEGEAWKGKALPEIMSDELSQRILALDRRVQEEGRVRFSFQVQDQEGRLRRFEAHKFLIHRDEGPPWIGGISLDVTDSQPLE